MSEPEELETPSKQLIRRRNRWKKIPDKLANHTTERLENKKKKPTCVFKFTKKIKESFSLWRRGSALIRILRPCDHVRREPIRKPTTKQDKKKTETETPHWSVKLCPCDLACRNRKKNHNTQIRKTSKLYCWLISDKLRPCDVSWRNH